MRLFLASFLSPDNREFYDSLVSDVISDVPDTLRPVPRDTQHLTMVFLGDIADTDLHGCVQALEAVGGIVAIRFALGPPRIMFARRSPRLVCVDLTSGVERVSALQKRLHINLSERLPTPITPPKPPHITLARFRKNANREAARRVAASLAQRIDPPASRSDQLTRVQLVKSTLTPSGPVYEGVRS